MKGWTLVLAVGLVLPPAAGAQRWEDYDYENLQFRGLGLDFGGVWPTETEPAASVGVRADMGYVGPHVRITPSVRFWSSTVRQREVDRLAEQIVRICERQANATCPASLDLGGIRRSDLVLAADAHYVFTGNAPLAPYAGGGLSLHLLNGRGEAISGTFVEDLLDTVAPGLDLIGGLSLPLLPAVELVAEARFVVTSDIQYANLAVGGTWTFPSPPAQPSRLRRPIPLR